jgi:outer membrane protein assembly factor BamB
MVGSAGEDMPDLLFIRGKYMSWIMTKRPGRRSSLLFAGRRKELWRRSYGLSIKRKHGMSRTVPAVTADYVLTIGPRCQVMCVKRETGDFLWGIDLVKEYQTEVPLWFTGQCPMIDNNKAILAPGGSALMIAVDCATGKVLWETPNPDKLKMSHSSIMPWTLNGKRMYVYSANGGVVGFRPKDPTKENPMVVNCLEPCSRCAVSCLLSRWEAFPDGRIWGRKYDVESDAFGRKLFG